MEQKKRRQKPQSVKKEDLGTPPHGGPLGQLTWILAVIKSLIEGKFYGELHLTFKAGVITSAEKGEKLKPPNGD